MTLFFMTLLPVALSMSVGGIHKITMRGHHRKSLLGSLGASRLQLRLGQPPRLMPLFSPDTGRRMSRIPHQAEFYAWCSRLTSVQLQAIRAELQRKIDDKEIHRSSWMPRSDWTGTVWHPIYTDACNYNEAAAGRCLGLFVWEAFMNHPKDWSFGCYPKDDMPIQGMTYFRVQK